MASQLAASLAAARKKRAAPATTTTTKVAAPKAAPIRPTRETIIHTCGHVEIVAESMNTPCPGCRLRAKSRRASRSDRDAQMDAKGRLPDGASFTVAYNSRFEMWTGRLVIGGKEYAGEASGVFRLLGDLDKKFRAESPAAEGPKAEGPTAAAESVAT